MPASPGRQGARRTQGAEGWRQLGVCGGRRGTFGGVGASEVTAGADLRCGLTLSRCDVMCGAWMCGKEAAGADLQRKMVRKGEDVPM